MEYGRGFAYKHVQKVGLNDMHFERKQQNIV